MFEGTRKEITILELMFNGEWLFYSDSDNRCILVELKNINQKSIYDKHNSSKDLHTSTQKVDSLNNSLRGKKIGDSTSVKPKA